MNTMNQDLTDGKMFKTNQIFIKFQPEDDKDIDIIYSYPWLKNPGAHEVELLIRNQDRIDDMFNKVKEERKTTINYAAFDYETGKKRCVRTAHPIIVKGKFYGAIIWESDLR